MKIMKDTKSTRIESPSDRMRQSIRNVYWLYVVMFAFVIAYLGYFMLVTSKQIVGDAHNPRLSVMDKEIKRGNIYDDKGNTIAYSKAGDDTYYRVYPNDKNMCHLIGYVNKGRAGIEASYNFDLQKMHNEVWQRISQLVLGKELEGNSITLTTNSAIQESAFEQLGRKKGAVIVMEPDTGKILAMQSYPNYNPNTIAENWEELDSNNDSPFLNRATQGLYTPGSVFKIITAAALIENRADYSNIEYVCNGEEFFKDKVIHCFDSRKHGEVDLTTAMAYSCNTFFSTEGQQLGAQRLIDSANARYFNKPLSYPLEHNKSNFQLTQSSSDSEIVETSIGQGKTVVSPLHVAMITSAVANDGVMMKPYIVDHITGYNDKVVTKNLPKMLDMIFTVEEAAALREMMHEVVKIGTGSAANIGGTFVAGKTGTAENPNGTSHSWFTVFAEKDGKKVVVTVVLENPEVGQSAVPIATNILETAIYNLE